MSQKSDHDSTALICVLDDDADVRDSLATLLRSAGYRVAAFADPESFLAYDGLDDVACLVLDVRLGPVDGLDFQQELANGDNRLPVILMSGHGDIPMTVRGMRAGAVTFLPKPFEEEDMLSAIGEAVALDQERRVQDSARDSLRSRFDSLTPRERDVLGLVAAGLMNKQIAGRLDLSEITVKIHRGNMMRKMQAESLADLAIMAESLGVREPISRYKRD